MDEFELIETFFVTGGDAPGVSTGIGDDGAVLRLDAGTELVAVVDTMVQGVHWPAGMEPFDVGYRAVAVNLSDVAAMGAEPRWMTLALTLPEADRTWLTGFAKGLQTAAAESGVTLVGGDTTRGETIVISVHVLGQVETGKALLRSGATPGDQVYVSGTVGDAAAGLAILSAGGSNPALVRRFTRPAARLGLGRILSGVATATIDASDGLYADLGKLLAASGVGGVLDIEQLPLSQELQKCFAIDEQRRFALTGGDDYELIFTLPPGEKLPATEVPVTHVGEVVAGNSLECRLNGKIVSLTDAGYRHFQ